jgi:hypothetical protein
MSWNFSKWDPDKEKKRKARYEKKLKSNARWLKTELGLAARNRYNTKRNKLLRRFGVKKLADLYEKCGIADDRHKSAHRIDLKRLISTLRLREKVKKG